MSSLYPRKRIGRLLYRNKCDPYVMLSHALGATKTTWYLKPGLSQCSKSESIIAKYDEAPVDSYGFDLNEFINCILPELWEIMNQLTLSNRVKHGWKQTESHAHERIVRIAYLVCVVMFCASGGHCSVPLHTLLTDYIEEATGGSSELISVLNKLGAVASTETLDRHIMRVSVQR